MCVGGGILSEFYSQFLSCFLINLRIKTIVKIFCWFNEAIADARKKTTSWTDGKYHDIVKLSVVSEVTLQYIFHELIILLIIIQPTTISFTW